jgi:hypothetical protein
VFLKSSLKEKLRLAFNYYEQDDCITEGDVLKAFMSLKKYDYLLTLDICSLFDYFERER